MNEDLENAKKNIYEILTTLKTELPDVLGHEYVKNHPDILVKVAELISRNYNARMLNKISKELSRVK